MYLFALTTEYRVIIGISAMVLLFSGFLISFVTSQRKKLQYHKDLQLLNDQQQQLLQEQNSLLEQRVNERTHELHQQKEALQRSLKALKETQTYLIQREKMASLGELTAGIAHEIQNPLNFVNNFAEISAEILGELKEEVTANNRSGALILADDLIRSVQKIGQHGGRASSIVRGMLEHSHNSVGERQLTDLNALTNEYLRLSYQSFRAKDKTSATERFNCTLIKNFDPAMGEVNLVAQDIGRVLLNLFNNAFYAVAQRAGDTGQVADYQPMVTVETQRMANSICIRVIDNGTGIPDAVQAKIFQPFFTTKPSGQGTGLGLSLSYDIITKEHAGELHVLSQVGKGSEFSINLPQ